MAGTGRSWILFALLIAGVAVGAPQIPSAGPRNEAVDGQAAAIRYVPDDLQDTSWLKKLGAAQAKTIESVKAFHDFTFTDRRKESGITFQHHIVPDAGKTYKAAHYDHGNGLTDIYFVNQVGGNQLWRNAGGGRFQTSLRRPGSRFQIG